MDTKTEDRDLGPFTAARQVQLMRKIVEMLANVLTKNPYKSDGSFSDKVSVAVIGPNGVVKQETQTN